MQRLDKEMAARNLVSTRSQAESYVRMGQVLVNQKPVTKPGFLVASSDKIKLLAKELYVSRAAYKLEHAAKTLRVDFKNKVVLDVGSSTGGFTEFALKRGAQKVIAVDVGTNQMHPALRGDKRIELHEQTDIRDFKPTGTIDIVLIDASFISLREILPAIAKSTSQQTLILAMAKPQFEAAKSGLKHKGVIKNNRVRRQVLKDLENWIQKLFIIADKADSEVAGSKGNIERFYLLKRLS